VNYTITPPVAEVAEAKAAGWTLSAVLRMPVSADAPTGSPMVLFRDGQKSWQLGLGTEVDGDPIVVALTAAPQTGPRHVIEGGAGEYHRFDLVYDPVTQTADLHVDGEVVITGYTGFANTTRLILWGHGSSSDTGRANFSLVRFSTAPIRPPPVPALPPRGLLLLGLLLLAASLAFSAGRDCSWWSRARRSRG
jgi:hypothetical protein